MNRRRMDVGLWSVRLTVIVAALTPARPLPAPAAASRQVEKKNGKTTLRCPKIQRLITPQVRAAGGRGRAGRRVLPLCMPRCVALRSSASSSPGEGSGRP